MERLDDLYDRLDKIEDSIEANEIEYNRLISMYGEVVFNIDLLELLISNDILN